MIQFDFHLLLGFLANLFGTAIILFLAVEDREVIVNNKKQIKRCFGLKIFLSHFTGWLLNVKKHKTCRTPMGSNKGKCDHLAVKALAIYILIFINYGIIFSLIFSAFPQINFWGFNQLLKFPNLDFVPYVGKYLVLTSICLNSQHTIFSWWFNIVYAILGLAGFNKVVSIWFTHSEKARLVECVILDDDDLPDNYDSIIQLNRDQVRVCYIGNSISGDVFVSKRKEISDGVGHKVDVRLGNYGEVYITFGERERQAYGVWKSEERRLILERQEKYEYKGYTYAFHTNLLLPNGEREIKIGHCEDPQGTARNYRRGFSNFRYILLVPESGKFNENLVHQALEKYHSPSSDDRKGGGEFFRECDGLYRILKKMLDQLPQETLKASVIPEGIDDAFAENDMQASRQMI